ncbi:MAG: hypothetical protein AB1942_10005 [Pseudomonadota bacterium]
MWTFTLKLLPAADGDCLILSWGIDQHVNHMVVDGGRAGAYPHLRQELAGMAAKGQALELYVLTHIDADHIEGALAFLKDKARPLTPNNVWYNGYRQMRGSGRRSMKQGDDYAETLDKLRWPVNRHFAGGVATIEAAREPIDVAGLKVTMLSPDQAHLKALGDRWVEWRRQQAAADTVRPGTRASRRTRNPIPDPLILEDLVSDGKEDGELPNGTSIAFLAEWGGRRVLLGGDAHPGLLASSLGPLADAEGGRYRVDLLKASHHGSMGNTSRELVQRLDCRQIALSSNGNLHGHPDPQAVARFVHFGVAGRKILHFNYDTDRTRPWANPEIKDRYDYEVRYPAAETPGLIEIDLMA